MIKTLAFLICVLIAPVASGQVRVANKTVRIQRSTAVVADPRMHGLVLRRYAKITGPVTVNLYVSSRQSMVPPPPAKEERRGLLSFLRRRR